MLSLRTPSLGATHAVAASIASLVRRGDVIVLAGEMGAGKTAFAQGFGRALGVHEPITSPTFTLVHSYDGGRLPMLHADLYRLGTVHEVDDLGLLELVEGRGVLLVEWGDVVALSLGDHLLVHLEVDLDDESARHIVLSGTGAGWATRWQALIDNTATFAC